MQNEIYSKEFEAYLKNFEILYVEDEEHIRALLEKRLSRHFGKIHTAQNGEVGLYKFETHRPKIVITDIRMPIMDGLEMLAAIKEKSPAVKAIVTTAHNDTDFMMKSIEIGIDRYIVKPIDVETLISSVKKICFGLYNEQLAAEYQRKSVAEQFGFVMTNVFEQMSRSIPNPMILYSQGKPVFINKAFTELFSAELIGRIGAGEVKMEELFETENGQKAQIVLPSGRKKIFSYYKTTINIAEQTDALLYSFNDLTAFEYQNAKLKSYADILYDILRVKQKTQEETAAARSVQSPEIKTQSATFTQSLSGMLTNAEMEALKRSHIVKISAAEYVKDITEDVLEELDELRELEAEISDIIDAMEDDGEFGSRAEELGAKFISYSRSIGKLLEFEDLATAVKNFGSFIAALQNQNSVKWSRVMSYVQNIKLDLISWRNTIFVERNTLDIHYLDSSLMSSCIQIQLNSAEQEAGFDDENDLELF